MPGKALEIIGFTLQSCLLAQAAGADRIELCDNPGEGGTTPSAGMIRAVREKITIQLFPMIRPRGGDFLYNEEEFWVMKSDLRYCREYGCDGVVLGILNKNGRIDKERCKILVDLAYPMETTFHRAFDRTRDPDEALEDCIECGFTRILSSGLQPTAIEGIVLLYDLVKLSDERITIMPGSGIRADNILSIANKTGADEFHSSSRKMMSSKMEYINPAMKEGLQYTGIDEDEIKKMSTLLKSIA